MNNRDVQLEEALSVIRREHQRIAAPQSTKALLIREVTTSFKRSKSARRLWPKPILLGSAFFLICWICATNFFLARHPAPKPEFPISTATRPQPDMESVREDPLTRPSQTRAHGRRIRAIRPASSWTSNIGEFVTLPSSEGLPAPTVATVVQMRIRRDDLREFGMDVPPTAAPETVLAEFVVGEDGLSRAVRLVR